MEVNRIWHGNALDVLRTLPSESVQAAVTSPPYWGALRDYHVPATVWDGEEQCQHEWGEPQRAPWVNSVAGPNGRKKNTRAGHWKGKKSGQFCLRCGAWQGCLGQEPDPQAYVDHLVQVFREVRRVLRNDGTLWLNLGDTYWGKGSKQQVGNLHAPRLQNKNLVGIPWRVALALQADGWILRSDNVWQKPNAQPECLDPCTPVFVLEEGKVLKRDLDWVFQQRHRLGDIKILGPSGWVAIRDVWECTKETVVEFDVGKVAHVRCSAEHRFPISRERRNPFMRYTQAQDIRDEGYGDALLFQPIEPFLPGHFTALDLVALAVEQDVPLNVLCAKAEVDTTLSCAGLSKKYGYPVKKYATADGSWCYGGPFIDLVSKGGAIPARIVVGEECSYNGKKVRLQRPREQFPASFPLDAETGYFLGLYAAEGGFERTRTGRGYRAKLTFQRDETDLLNYCQAFLGKYGTESTITTKGNTAAIRFSSGCLWLVLSYLIPGSCANRALNLDVILNTPRVFRQGLLDGYLAGNGSKKGVSGFRATSISKQLRDGMATLCSSLGMIVSKGTYLSGRKGTRTTEHVLWTSSLMKRQAKQSSTCLQIPPRGMQVCSGSFRLIDLEVEGNLFLIKDGIVSHNSVRDRPTRSHEYVFLFSKAPRYFYDADAVREPHTMKPQRRLTQRHSTRDEAMRPDKKYRYRLRDEPGVEGHPAGRNRRTVWSINTAAFDARRLGIEDVNHFAVMPAALAEICVLASTSPRACEVCGAPWRRSTARETHYEGGSGRAGRSPDVVNARGKWAQREHGKHLKLGPVVEVHTLSWHPTCACPESKGTGHCLVLDPFAGAATVLATAASLGCDYLGIELNPQYLRLGEQNIRVALDKVRRPSPRHEHDGTSPDGVRQLRLLDEEQP